jgi:hypothetical protein
MESSVRYLFCPLGEGEGQMDSEGQLESNLEGPRTICDGKEGVQQKRGR